MKLKVVACDVLYREVCQACAVTKHATDVVFVPFGLHNTPTQLRERLQQEIDDADSQDYDAIVFAYGLCSRGTAELEARSKKLVLPKAHDCITLLLGSRERYDQEFTGNPGTYYYSAGWVECKNGDVRQGYVTLQEETDRETRFREYVGKYGEDNAQYLMDQEALWMSHYTRAAFIDAGLGDIERYREFTSTLAKERGWRYAELPGDRRLIDKLIHGEWDADFLVVKPGERIVEAFNAEVVKSGRG